MFVPEVLVAELCFPVLESHIAIFESDLLSLGGLSVGLGVGTRLWMLNQPFWFLHRSVWFLKSVMLVAEADLLDC